MSILLCTDAPSAPTRNSASKAVDSPHTEAYQAAVHYSGWGWSVIPLYKKKPAVRYRRHGKLHRGWQAFQSRQARGELLDELFGGNTRPDAGGHRAGHHPPAIDGVGVVCGPISGGLCVRDFDDLDAYIEWARAHPDWVRRLPTVRTARGVHVYFRVPRGRGPVYRKFRDGELIGDSRHYVVLPPSRHPSGIVYRWHYEPLSPDEFPVVSPEELGFLTGDEPVRPREAHVQQESGPVPAPTSLPDIESAIENCLPSGPGQRNSCLLRLARYLKAVPGMAGADEATLKGVVARWHERALTHITTRSLAVSVREFLATWPGARPMTAGGAFADAMAAGLTDETPPEVEQYDNEDARKLGKACRRLQLYYGRGAFFLSARTAAEVCGMRDHRVAHAWLSQFVEDGVLTLVRKGTQGKSGRASEYSFPAYQEEDRESPPAEAPKNPIICVHKGFLPFSGPGDLPAQEEVLGLLDVGPAENTSYPLEPVSARRYYCDTADGGAIIGKTKVRKTCRAF